MARRSYTFGKKGEWALALRRGAPDRPAHAGAEICQVRRGDPCGPGHPRRPPRRADFNSERDNPPGRGGLIQRIQSPKIPVRFSLERAEGDGVLGTSIGVVA